MLSNKKINALGGLAKPFERYNRNLIGTFRERSVNRTSGEHLLIKSFFILPRQKMDFLTAISNNYVSSQYTSSPTTLCNNESEKRLLWVIDEDGLKIGVEKHSDRRLLRGKICHSNITGNKAAIQGGEMWVSSENYCFINNYSGRYDSVNEQEFNEAIEYIKSMDVFRKIIFAFSDYRIPSPI